MVERNILKERQEPLNLGNVDTYVFDYGGVVSHHYCEPWQSNISDLLNISSKQVKGLLSESGALGRDYRLGKVNRDDFWQRVIEEAGGNNVDPSELEYNWAMSYQIDPRMLRVVGRLKAERGVAVGLLSNSDQYRQEHNEREYKLSQNFDFVISSHTHGVVKPEDEAYIKMLQVAGRYTHPGKVLYVDDRDRNIVPAQNMGIQGYVFNGYEDFIKLLHSNGILKFK